MLDRQSRAQCGAITAIKTKQSSWWAIVEPLLEAVEQPPTNPRCPQHFALEVKERDLVKRVGPTQPFVEFQSVYDPHRWTKMDVLRPEIPMAVHDTAGFQSR